MSEHTELLQVIGYTGRKLEDTLNNEKSLANILKILEEAGITTSSTVSAEVGTLLHEVATRFPENALVHRPFLLSYILKGSLNRVQLGAAINYFKSNGAVEFEVSTFESNCGIGVASLSDEELQTQVTEVVAAYRAELEAKGWAFAAKIYGDIKNHSVLRWMDGYSSHSTASTRILILSKTVSTAVDNSIIALIGPRPVKGAKKVEKPEAGSTVTAAPKISEDELTPDVRIARSVSLSVQQYRELRIRAIEAYRGAGYNPYPHKFETTITIAEFRSKYEFLKNQESVEDKAENICRLAGRITAVRSSSVKLVFYTITKDGHDLQVMANFRAYSNADEFNRITELLRRGDIVGIVGLPCRSNTGELSIVPKEIQLLSPCLHNMPPPESLHDMETRYRNRYLDLIVNRDAATTFKIRSQIIAFIRQFFNIRGFLEVETPTMNLLAGGATAKPFVTYHNDLHVNLFMRVAPELYLKQLIIGGLDKVYEIGKNYRNEGIDLTHNPEFTAIEIYQAYADYNDLMDMTEELLSSMVLAIHGKYQVTYHPDGKHHGLEREELIAKLSEKLGVTFPADLTNTEGKEFIDRLLESNGVICKPPVTLTRQLDALALKYIVRSVEIDFTPPYRRVSMVATLEEKLGITFPQDIGSEEANAFLKTLCIKHKVECSPPHTNARLLDKLVGEFIEPELMTRPGFITDHPQIMSPLAKWHRSRPSMTERFELFVGGRELCNAYTELNDPAVQRSRFEEQSADRSKGDDEAQPIDEGFCTSLEYGLPPTGGWGLGIDRLVMFLTDQNNIKEVILFPALKPSEAEREAQVQQLKYAIPADLSGAFSVPLTVKQTGSI